MFRLIIYALIAVGAWKAYTTYQARQQQAAAIQLLNEPRARDIDVGRNITPTKPKYQCDGRTHCSQMAIKAGWLDVQLQEIKKVVS